MYTDYWRPKLHLAPYRGSISDPNGLNQFLGTYHIFCQNAPTYPPCLDSPHGWGHFASRDLVNWVFLGCHVMPDAACDADGSYSGGAYIADDELWLYYTGNIREGDGDGTTSGRLANQTRMRSYNGINLANKEVVMTNDEYPAYCSCHVRDPKVWEEDGELHMMLGARTLADSRGSVICYRSSDGVNWEFEGSVTNLEDEPFGYMWECPDRIVLDGREFLGCCPQGTENYEFSCQNVHSAGYFPIEGTVLDVLHEDTELMEAAAPHAAIDQASFTDWDYGFDFYACQTLVDEKGRCLLVGWMSLPHDKYDVRPYDNPTPTWRGCLTVPRELSWSEKHGRVVEWPVEEIEGLRGEPYAFEQGEDGLSATIDPRVADVVIEGASDGTLRFGEGLELRFSDGVAELAFVSDEWGQGRHVRRARCGEVENIRVLVDTSVLEIFVNDGSVVFGTRYYAPEGPLTLVWTGAAERAEVYPMRPITLNYLVER